jgi:hypothetical protein
MIDIDKVNFEGLIKGYKYGREQEATKLKAKLDRASRWKKRYDRLVDKKVEEEVIERLAKLKKLAREHHIQFNLINVSKDSFSGGVNARYLWGDVTLDLQGWLIANNDGVVILTLHTSTDYSQVYRISVGQRTTVTNNILQVLMARAAR